MSTNWMFYTNIKKTDMFVSKINEFYNTLIDTNWEDYGEEQTPMHDGKGYSDCFNMKIITDNFVRQNSNLHEEFFKLINFNDKKFPMNIMLKFFKLEKGTRFTPHFDNPKCAILYHFNEPDPIQFYNEKNENIFSVAYKFALVNTSIKHGVEELTNDRIWFKISISNYGYYQVRELLHKNNLIKND